MDPRERATAEALADPSGFRSFLPKVAITRARQMDRPFAVEVSDRTVDGAAGDYLCLHLNGTPFVWEKDAFEREFVEQSAAVAHELLRL